MELLGRLFSKYSRILRQEKTWTPLVGDGCYLPLKDKLVDFVFSNVVIEHLPKDKRELFAQEINRAVRKGYFVTTPNYWFPYKPNYKMPFWQYLPDNVKKAILTKTSIGHHKKGSYRKIPLLSSRELRNYYPRACIYYLKVTRFHVAEVLCANWRTRDTHK